MRRGIHVGRESGDRLDWTIKNGVWIMEGVIMPLCMSQKGPSTNFPMPCGWEECYQLFFLFDTWMLKRRTRDNTCEVDCYFVHTIKRIPEACSTSLIISSLRQLNRQLCYSFQEHVYYELSLSGQPWTFCSDTFRHPMSNIVTKNQKLGKLRLLWGHYPDVVTPHIKKKRPKSQAEHLSRRETRGRS